MKILNKHPVYWIGGSFSGGKSTTCRILVARHQLEPYFYDRHLLGDPEFRETRVKDEEWFWLPNKLKSERYRRSFPMAVGQISQIAESMPVLAEGPGLLPELLHQAQITPEKILFLLPTPQFQRTVNPQRGAWVEQALARRPHDPTAWESWMKLDEEFADFIEASAKRFGYRVVRNDGSLSADEIARIVEEHFGLGDTG